MIRTTGSESHRVLRRPSAVTRWLSPGAGKALCDEIVDRRGSAAGLLLPHLPGTGSGSVGALGAIPRGRNVVTSPFRV